MARKHDLPYHAGFRPRFPCSRAKAAVEATSPCLQRRADQISEDASRPDSALTCTCLYATTPEQTSA
jgi:hypothetical protein